MSEYPAAVILLALLGAGAAAILATPRGWRAALVLAERPLTWLSPVLLALLVQYVTRRFLGLLHVEPDLSGRSALQFSLLVGALGLVESLPVLAVLSGQIALIRRALDGVEPSPGDFWNGIRANFPTLVVVRVLFGLIGMVLQTFPILIPSQYRLAGWIGAGLVILAANVEIHAVAALLGAGPAAPKDLFQRVDRIPRSRKWSHLLPVALQLLGMGVITLFPAMVDTREGRESMTVMGFHTLCVFDYGLDAHWFADLTRDIATFNPGRSLMLSLLGVTVGLFSVLLLTIHMQFPVPAPDAEDAEKEGAGGAAARPAVAGSRGPENAVAETATAGPVAPIPDRPARVDASPPAPDPSPPAPAPVPAAGVEESERKKRRHKRRKRR